MALEEHVVDIPLVGGLAQKNGVAVLAPPSFAQLDNSRIDKAGSIYPRHGFAAITAPVAVAAIAKNDDALLGRSIIGMGIYQRDREAWVGATPSAGFGDIPVMPADVYVSDAPGDDAGVYKFDFATNSDEGTPECFVSTSPLGTRISATIRAADGTLLLGPKWLTVDTPPVFMDVRVVAIGTVFYVMSNSHVGAIYAWSCDTASGPMAWSPGELVFDSGTASPFDLEVNADDGELIVARWNASDSVVEVYRLDTSFATLASFDTTCAVVPEAISVRYDGTKIITVYGIGGGGRSLRAASASANLGATYFTDTKVTDVGVGAAFLMTDALLVSESDPGVWLLVWTERYSEGVTAIRCGYLYGDGTPLGPVTDHFHLSQVARMPQGPVPLIPAQTTLGLYFTETDITNLGGILLLPAMATTNPSPSPGEDMRMYPVARFAVDRCASINLCRTVGEFDMTGGSFEFAVGSIQGMTGRTGVTQIAKVKIDIPGQANHFVERDGVTYWGGGMLTAYDGHIPQEAGPAYDPRIVATDVDSGGVLDAGVYAWKVVYEWVDFRGVLHRSAPSPAVTATLSANDSMTLSVGVLSVGVRGAANAQNYRIALYRTKKDGSVFYLVNGDTTRSPSAVSGCEDIWDGIVDDDALGQILYTEGDAAPAGRTPPAWDMAFTSSRAWLLSADRRTEFWFSKPFEALLAPEFDAGMVVDVGRGTGMAVASMDDKVVMFTDGEIFVTYGEGPNATGFVGSFARPQPIPTETGCKSRGSVCECPPGVVFQGARGLYLLTRAMQVVFIGADVEDDCGEGAEVTSAVLAPDGGEVWFGLASGITLAWNYETNQWRRWTGLGNQGNALILGGDYHVCDGTATIRVLDEEVYADTFADPVVGQEMVARTGWIRLGAMHAYQRCKRIYINCEKFGVCGLAVKARFNDSDTSVTLRTISDAEITAAALTGKPLRVHVPNQKCTSMQIHLESDGVAAGLGNIAIHGLSLVVATNSKRAPIAAAGSF